MLLPLFKLRQMFVAMFVLTTTAMVGFGQIKSDPNVPDELKAVLAVNLDMKALQAYPLFQALTESTPMGGNAPFAPTDIARMTAFVGVPKSLGPDMFSDVDFYVYIGFHSPAVVAKVKAEMMEKGGKEVTVGGKQLFSPGEAEFPPGVYLDFLKSAVVVGSEPYLTSPSKQFATKNLADAYGGLERLPVRIAVDMDGMRELMDQAYEMANAEADAMTKSFLPLIKEASTLTLASDITKDTLLRLSITGHDEKDAKGIKLKLDAALGMGQTSSKMLAGNPGMEDVINAINELEVVKSGNTSVLNVPKPKGFDEMLTGAMMAGRGAAKKTQDMNNFKMASLAMLNYESVYRKLPFAEHAMGEDANSGLSWKVRVLPFMEQIALYEKFDMKSGYDSAQNAPLAKIKIPDFELNTGGEIRWVRPKKIATKISQITDGTSNTIAFIQCKKISMEPWTKPVSMTAEEAVQQLKNLKDGESFIVGFYDGSVRSIDKSMSVEVFEMMLDPSDGKVIPFDR